MKSAAFFPICRRLCIGVAHRGRHASGLEHLCTTRPSGFRASLRRLGSWSVAGDTRAVSNTSVLLVRAVSEPPALHRLGSWSVAGDTRAVSNTSVLLVRAVSSTSVLLVRAVSEPPSLRRLGSWSVAGVTRAVSNTSVLLVRAVSEPSRSTVLVCSRARASGSPTLYYSSERFPASRSGTSGSWSVAGVTRAVSNTSVLLVRAVSEPPALHRLGSWSVAGDARAVSNTSVLLVRAAPPRVADDARAVSANAVLPVRAVSPPPERGAPAGPTFSNTPVDRRHPLDTIRSTEAGRARETSGNCECGTTAQAGDAASSVSFRGDGARREPAAVPVPPARSDSWRSGTIRAAGRLHQRGLRVGAPRRRRASLARRSACSRGSQLKPTLAGLESVPSDRMR